MPGARGAVPPATCVPCGLGVPVPQRRPLLISLLHFLLLLWGKLMEEQNIVRFPVVPKSSSWLGMQGSCSGEHMGQLNQSQNTPGEGGCRQREICSHQGYKTTLLFLLPYPSVPPGSLAAGDGNMQALECRAHSISAASAASCHGPGISLPILKPTPPVADPRTRVPQGELAALHAAQERGCPWREEMPAPFLLIAGSSTVQEKLQKLPDLHLCSACPGVQGPSALQSRRWKGRTNTKGGEKRPGAE